MNTKLTIDEIELAIVDTVLLDVDKIIQIH